MKAEIKQKNGRFVIFIDGRETNAWAASRDKAEKILEKALASMGHTQTSASAAPRPPRPAPAPAPRSRGKGVGYHDVMLAKEWEDHLNPARYWWSEKLNGIRAFWDGEKLYTRNGNVISLPKFFSDALPSTPLDGELWYGRGKDALQQMVSIKAKTTDRRWAGVKFAVFDAPLVPGAAEKRWEEAKRVLRGNKVAFFLEQFECKTKADVEKLFKAVLAQGGEGLMARLKGSRYSGSRTSDLLKKKPVRDAEAVITGYEPGKGRHAGVLGAYHVHFVHDPKIKFKVGTGLSDRDRARRLPVGTVITVQWKNETPSGKPHPASFVGVRDYEGPKRGKKNGRVRRNSRRVAPHNWVHHEVYARPNVPSLSRLDYMPVETDEGFVKPTWNLSDAFFRTTMSAGFIDPEGRVYDLQNQFGHEMRHEDFASEWHEANGHELEPEFDTGFGEHDFSDSLVGEHGWVRIGAWNAIQLPPDPTDEQMYSVAWVVAQAILQNPQKRMEDEVYLSNEGYPAAEVVERFGKAGLIDELFSGMDNGSWWFARRNRGRKAKRNSDLSVAASFPFNPTLAVSWSVRSDDITKGLHGAIGGVLDVRSGKTVLPLIRKKTEVWRGPSGKTEVIGHNLIFSFPTHLFGKVVGGSREDDRQYDEMKKWERRFEAWRRKAS